MGYQRAYAGQGTTDKVKRLEVSRELGDVEGVNGRIQDIKDAYSLYRDLYEQAWLRSNRPYAFEAGAGALRLHDRDMAGEGGQDAIGEAAVE